MKTAPLFVLLLTALLYGFSGAVAQQNSLTEEQLHLRQEVKPYLDSLIIEEPKPGDKELSQFRLEAIFPAKTFTRFGTNEGKFTAFTPDNPKLKGIVTEPIPLLDGARISIIYSFADDFENKVLIDWKYRFESVKVEKSPEKGMARQSLYLTLLNGLRFSKVKVGLMDVVILPPDNEGKNINNLPSLGYRSMSFSRAEGDQYMLSYLLKTSEGVYSPIAREEGSDRTFPEYTGGSAAQFRFIRQNMEYPEEAIRKQVSGTVLVSCTVEPDGSVTNPHIFLGSEPLLNDEAIRLVALTSGKWIPATRNGENIADEKVIPVPFRLEDATGENNIIFESKKPEKKWPIKKILFFGAIGVALILYLRRKFNKGTETGRPDPSLRPVALVNNDKMVIVAGVSEEQMDVMLCTFADIYNSRDYDAIIRMHPINNQVFALTFPYDMKWEIFTELIDHLIYFDESEQKAQTKAWLTLPEQCEPVAGEHGMLSIKEDDENYDLIRITTQYNRGWKVDYETERLVETEVFEEYVKPPFPYYEIIQKPFKEID